MKYQLIHKYCPVTTSKKSWEAVIGVYETRDEAEQAAEAIMKPPEDPHAAAILRGFTSRMLFVIQEIGDENGNNC